ncbi:MAG: hypothetical protein LBQ59_03765 [Candidatus Peribacteria bacterium]|nr:hypothetical protein [Candidatus Peribacteria bacterium]
MYDYDWSSYWYSTQSKNNAFMAFQKYLQKTGVNNVADFTFAVKSGNKENSLSETLGGKEPNIKTFKFNLDGVTSKDENGASVVFDDVKAEI